jgi:hypothetical protein
VFYSNLVIFLIVFGYVDNYTLINVYSRFYNCVYYISKCIPLFGYKYLVISTVPLYVRYSWGFNSYMLSAKAKDPK